MRSGEQQMSKKTYRTYFGTTGVYRDIWSGEEWTLIYRHRVWRPPTDVYETDSNIVVRVEIAGVRKEDFQLSLSGEVLVISGWRRDPAAKLAYQRMEINYGEFRTEVHLPWALSEDEIDAVYEDGFLSVLLPKRRRTHVPLVGADE